MQPLTVPVVMLIDMSAISFVASATDVFGAPARDWESPPMLIAKILVVLVLVLLNGFFAPASSPSREFARLSEEELRLILEERESGPNLAHKPKDRCEDFRDASAASTRDYDPSWRSGTRRYGVRTADRFTTSNSVRFTIRCP